MARSKFCTTIDTDLFNLVQAEVEREELKGLCTVIERALRLYYANRDTEVWEKVEGATLKKVVKKPNKVIFQNITSRRLLTDVDKYTHEELITNGFKNVWSITQRM